jgi:calcium binding protein 39
MSAYERYAYEHTEIDANPEQQFQLINALVAEDFLLPLTQLIQFLPFEGRKDTQFIFNSAFRYKHPTASAQEPIALHHILQSRPQIIVALCHGYDSQNSSWTCGKILQEAMKYDAVAALILYDEKDSLDHPLDLSTVQTDKPSSGEGVFWNFFDWITKTRFEVCADAWVTFKEVLTKHKEMVATWLETNYDLFFPKYIQRFVMSENYVTKRQSIKLLGELLLDRANYNVMTKFVDSADHLKTCMLLLRDDRKMISYEAFHVFKVYFPFALFAIILLMLHRCSLPTRASLSRCSACSSTTAPV